jgi:molecular chaperone GrpE (heat shock protein)
MPQETDWSPASVVLKEHFERILSEREKLCETRMESAANARAMALKELDRRLGEMNELRAQLNKQANTLATKEEVQTIRQAQQERLTIAKYEGDMKAIDTQLRVLDHFQTVMESKASQRSVTYALLVGLVSAVVGIVNLIERFLH